jgi:hypothetical protein
MVAGRTPSGRSRFQLLDGQTAAGLEYACMRQRLAGNTRDQAFDIWIVQLAESGMSPPTMHALVTLISSFVSTR